MASKPARVARVGGAVRSEKCCSRTRFTVCDMMALQQQRERRSKVRHMWRQAGGEEKGSEWAGISLRDITHSICFCARM